MNAIEVIYLIIALFCFYKVFKLITSTKYPTYQDGYNAATECLEEGEDPEELLHSSMNDLDPSEFTRGWQACIREWMKANK